MNRFLILCLIIIAVSLPAPVSAFVDSNDVRSGAQFKDYIPASYLKKAGVTDGMTVDQALDAYITYALSFSDKTSYAYIARITNPAQVKIQAGRSTTDASRGDPVSGGWDIEVDDGALVAIRYPGSVTHTITGPYTYTVPAYGQWGTTAAFGASPGGSNSKALATLPDTAGYKIVTKEIPCRGITNNAIQLAKVTGTVYAVHYSQNPADPKYFSYQVSAKMTSPLGDTTTLVVGPGSSATVDNLDPVFLPEKTVYRLEPRFSECVMDSDWSGKPTGTWREKTFIDSISYGIIEIWNGAQTKFFEITNPTVVAGVRG
ncbi:MAG: hypothetical protein CVV30_05020 [Methanomicrobiales archaeon HGW-Methanomicrobiales-1]|jgi:hypothetical protein|nr:MAG: hypothetical protein CVV30_05020 [Methanomicrobiales archaeon HGW-Methanomicrobiales-1]